MTTTQSPVIAADAATAVTATTTANNKCISQVFHEANNNQIKVLFVLCHGTKNDDGMQVVDTDSKFQEKLGVHPYLS